MGRAKASEYETARNSTHYSKMSWSKSFAPQKFKTTLSFMSKDICDHNLYVDFFAFRGKNCRNEFLRLKLAALRQSYMI